MRKNFGVKTWLYPMPVLMIATYNEDGSPNAMNAAWGGIYDDDEIMICIDHCHKTAENIKREKAFTVSFATAKRLVPCDYLGIVSGNDEPEKFEKAGFHGVKSNFVNAPLIEELPMALDCQLVKFNEDGICIGKILNVSADESVLDGDGKIDLKKLNPIIYDGVNHFYWSFGEKVGCAFVDGKKLKD